jgi:hypothetical protein
VSKLNLLKIGSYRRLVNKTNIVANPSYFGEIYNALFLGGQIKCFLQSSENEDFVIKDIIKTSY